MKTLHKTVSAALLSSLALITGQVVAAGDYPGNPEKSPAFDNPPAAKSQADVQAEFDAYRSNPASPDGWVDVGGERGAMLAPHKYAFVGSTLVSVGYADETASRQVPVWTAEDVKMASLNYRNAP